MSGEGGCQAGGAEGAQEEPNCQERAGVAEVEDEAPCQAEEKGDDLGGPPADRVRHPSPQQQADGAGTGGEDDEGAGRRRRPLEIVDEPFEPEVECRRRERCQEEGHGPQSPQVLPVPLSQHRR